VAKEVQAIPVTKEDCVCGRNIKEGGGGSKNEKIDGYNE